MTNLNGNVVLHGTESGNFCRYHGKDNIICLTLGSRRSIVTKLTKLPMVMHSNPSQVADIHPALKKV
jgi:hypothetical protein